jgi:dUTP pyrophosphatase
MQIINRNSLARSSKTSAGYDLCADLEEPEPLEPGVIALIPTGIALRLGGGDMIGKIYARSELATLHGVTLSTGVAIVDSSYEEEIFIGLVNTGGEDFILTPMMPIAQLLFERVIHPKFEEVEGFSEYDAGKPPTQKLGRLH